MLTFDQLDILIDPILDLYERYAQSVINDIAKRLAKLEMTNTAAWQMQRLIESGRVYENALDELSELTGKSEAELRKLFQKAGVRSMRFDDAIYKAVGLKPVPLNLSPAMTQVLATGLRKTQGIMRNLTLTTATSAQNVFIDAADLAYMQVSSGAFDYNTAIRNAVKEVADKGLSVISYASGRKDQLDVAVRRAVLTGVSQTAGMLTEARMDEMGVDLVQTSAHIGARNKGDVPENHEKWQGRIFSRTGSGGYPNFYEVTGYGTVTGLYGINCRHSHYAFYEGISEQLYNEAVLQDYASKTVIYNGKEMSVYEATQQQRYIERQIRHWKRQEEGLKAAGLDATEETAKVREWQGKMRDFIKQTGLQRQSERERISYTSNLVEAAKKINFRSKEYQYVADLGDIAKYYSPDDPGINYVTQRPVIYNQYAASHLINEQHNARLTWLEQNQDGLIKALQSPDFLEIRLRLRQDGHYSSTQIAELMPGTKNEKRFLAVAVSLSNDPKKGYHQITTVYPATWKDIFYTDGKLKTKYKSIK